MGSGRLVEFGVSAFDFPGRGRFAIEVRSGGWSVRGVQYGVLGTRDGNLEMSVYSYTEESRRLQYD